MAEPGPRARNGGVAIGLPRSTHTDRPGQRVGGGPLSITYLIDSDQNHTSANPNPSAVICLLVDANGQALTGSARR